MKKLAIVFLFLYKGICAQVTTINEPIQYYNSETQWLLRSQLVPYKKGTPDQIKEQEGYLKEVFPRKDTIQYYMESYEIENIQNLGHFIEIKDSVLIERTEDIVFLKDSLYFTYKHRLISK